MLTGRAWLGAWSAGGRREWGLFGGDAKGPECLGRTSSSVANSLSVSWINWKPYLSYTWIFQFLCARYLRSVWEPQYST